LIEELKKEVIDLFNEYEITLIDIQKRNTNQSGDYLSLLSYSKNPIFIDLFFTITVVETSLDKTPLLFERVEKINNVLEQSLLHISNSQVIEINPINIEDNTTESSYFLATINFTWRKVLNGI
jgi:hypothetical protein